MTRIPTWGAALLALALIVLAPGLALAQDATAPAEFPDWFGAALALIPSPYRVFALLAIPVASILDALLPHATPDTPKVLAIPRALITTLAVNVGNASNAGGIGLGTALKAVGGSVGGGIGAALTSPIAGIVATEVDKALAARTQTAPAATALPAVAAAVGAIQPTPANDTASPVAAPVNPAPAPAQ